MSAFRGDGREEWVGRCATHSEIAASFTCPRCGDHGCPSCERRVVEGAHPICPECWRRREERTGELVQDTPSHLPAWALGLGVVALIPMLWPAQLGAVVIGATALSRMESDAPRRPLAWAGIAMGILGALGTCVTFGLITS